MCVYVFVCVCVPAASHPNAPPNPSIIGNTRSNIHVSWGIPRSNGHDITGYRVEIFYLTPSDCLGLYHKASRKRQRKLAASLNHGMLQDRLPCSLGRV